MKKFGAQYGKVKHKILEVAASSGSDGFTVDDLKDFFKHVKRRSLAANLYRLMKVRLLRRVQKSKRGRNGEPAVYALNLSKR